jgi:hypothetical protein
MVRSTAQAGERSPINSMTSRGEAKAARAGAGPGAALLRPAAAEGEAEGETGLISDLFTSGATAALAGDVLRPRTILRNAAGDAGVSCDDI